MDDVLFRELFGLTQDEKDDLVKRVSQDVTFEDETDQFETEILSQDEMEEVA
jgi:hypothetical protein